MHFYTAGSGPALLLIHGTPKTSYYWYKLDPLLTPHFTIVAPDLRSFVYTNKPPPAVGVLLYYLVRICDVSCSWGGSYVS